MALRPENALAIPAARTALYAWLFARRERGLVELRFQNVDRSHLTGASRTALLDGLDWLGLDWDSGPHLQTDGNLRHIGAVDALVARQSADLGGPSQATRLAVPGRADVRFTDLIRGDIRVPLTALGKLTIRRRSGLITQNCAVAVDDRDARITHVVRGQDHLPKRTAQQVLVLDALEAPRPLYAHLPPILSPNGNPLRLGLPQWDGPASVQDLRAAGYSAGAVRSYLVAMGDASLGPAAGFDLGALVQTFRLEHVSSRQTVFDARQLLNAPHSFAVSSRGPKR